MKKSLVKSLTLSSTAIAAVSLANTVFADDAVDTTVNTDKIVQARTATSQELAKQVTKQESAVTTAQTDLKQAKQTVANQEQVTTDVQAQVAIAQSNADKASQVLAESKEAAKQATTENIAAAIQTINTAKEQVATATANVTATSATQSTAQESVDHQTAVVTQAEAKQTQASEAVNKANSANEDAKQNLSTAETALTNAKVQEERAQKEVSAVEAEIAETTAKNQKTNEDIQIQETALAKANDELKQANANKSEAIAQANELQAEITTKENDIASVNNSITSLKQKQETAQSELSGLGTYTLPQSYIDYVNGKSTDWNKALEDLKNISNNYRFVDQYERGYSDPATITRDDSKNLNIYVASLINNILKQLGKSEVKLAEGSLDFANSYTTNYQDSNYVFKEYNAKQSAAVEQNLSTDNITSDAIRGERTRTGVKQSYYSYNGVYGNKTEYIYADTSLNIMRLTAQTLIDYNLKDLDNFKKITDMSGYLAVSVTSDENSYYITFFNIPESTVTSETSSFNTTEIEWPTIDTFGKLQSQIFGLEDKVSSLTNEKNALEIQAKEITISAENNVTAAQANYDSQAQKLSDLKAQLINPDDLNKELATAKETLSAATKAVEDAQSAVTTATVKAKAAAETLASAQGDQKVAQKAVSDAKQSLADLNTQLAQAKENGDKATQDLQMAQAKLIEAEAAYKALLTVKDELATAQTAYDQAQATLATATEKLATEETKLVNLKVKQADAQATYDNAKTAYDKLLADYNRAKDLEEKAKTNNLFTLPDGTVTAIPKDSPTVEDKPALDINELIEPQVNRATATSQMPTAKQIQTAYNVAVTKSATQNVVERRGTTVSYKAQLPTTGEEAPVIYLLAGIAFIGAAGLVGKRKEN